MFENRPKIDLVLSRTDKVMEKTGQVMLVILWALTVYSLITLPTIIPTHFDAAGKVNGHGHKAMLLFMPILGTLLYWGMTYVNKYPHIFNYPVKITPENALNQYTNGTKMGRYLIIALVTLFIVIVLVTYLTVKGVIDGLGYWFLPFIIFIIFIPMTYFIIQAFKMK